MLLITEDSACVSRGNTRKGGVCQSYHDLEREIQKSIRVKRIDRFRGVHNNIRYATLSQAHIGRVLRLAFKIRYWSALITAWCTTIWEREVVLLCSDYTLRGWPKRLGIKSLVIVHDLIDEWQMKKSLHQELKQRCRSKVESVRSASGVIFVSTQTYKDFAKFYGIETLRGKKIKVIGHCTRDDVNAGIKSVSDGDFDVEVKRVLYIGERGGYKCFEEFIYAVGKIKDDIEKMEIIVVGRQFSEREKRMIARSGAVVSLLEHVSDYELGKLYATSDVLCYPSSMEGFGLPVLEAMKAKTPVICQELPCIREFAGDYPYYWDGKSQIDLARLLKLVLKQTPKKVDLSSRWIERTIGDVSTDYKSLINEVIS